MKHKLLTFLAHCGDWLYPPQCGVCTELLSTQPAICYDCRKTLPWNTHSCERCALPIETGQWCGTCLTNPPTFVQCITPFRYEPPISTLIIQLKFQQRLRYAQVLGQLLSESIHQHQRLLPECIIPMPLHPQRIRQRGFNQALEIARPLSKKFQLPLLYQHCYRRKNTLPQSQLSASARRSNLTGAFELRKKIPFKHIAIVDDVMTTGETVRTLSATLQRQGVQKIDVWCCARAV